MRYNDKSIRDNLEYGGLIYQTPQIEIDQQSYFEILETYELVVTVRAKAAELGKEHFRLIARHSRDGATLGLRYDHVVATCPYAGEDVLSEWHLSCNGDLTKPEEAGKPYPPEANTQEQSNDDDLFGIN